MKVPGAPIKNPLYIALAALLVLVVLAAPFFLIMALQEPAAPQDMRDELPDMRREFSAIMQALGGAAQSAQSTQSAPAEVARNDGASIGASFAPKDRLAFTRALYQAATAQQYRAAGSARGEWIPEPDLLLLMCSSKSPYRVLRVTEAGVGVAASLYANPQREARCAG